MSFHCFIPPLLLLYYCFTTALLLHLRRVMDGVECEVFVRVHVVYVIPLSVVWHAHTSANVSIRQWNDVGWRTSAHVSTRQWKEWCMLTFVSIRRRMLTNVRIRPHTSVEWLRPERRVACVPHAWPQLLFASLLLTRSPTLRTTYVEA